MAQIIVHNLEWLNEDTLPLLNACMARISTHQNVTEVNLYVSPRRHGWLEFLMRFTYDDGGGLTVGALQREVGKPFEFHS